MSHRFKAPEGIGFEFFQKVKHKTGDEGPGLIVAFVVNPDDITIEVQWAENRTARHYPQELEPADDQPVGFQS